MARSLSSGGDPAPLSPVDTEAIRKTALLGAFAFALTAAVYVVTLTWAAPFPRDGTTLVVGRDFLNFWMYGRAAWQDDPARFYDAAVYNGALREFLGPGYPGQNWSYPPSLMLLAAPFGLMPYGWALLVWTVLGGGIFYWFVLRGFPDRLAALALALSPAVALCLISGQSALMTTVLILTALKRLDRNLLLTSVCLGLLTLKPQLGVLFPLLLIALGRWRLFLMTTAIALLIVGVTALIWGMEVWRTFFTSGVATQNLVLDDSNMLAAPFMPTIFMNLRLAGAGYPASMAVQMIALCLATIAMVWIVRTARPGQDDMFRSFFLALTLVGLPYFLSYDTLPLTVAAMTLLATGRLGGFGRGLSQLVYWLPLLQMLAGQLHLPGPALVPVLFAGYGFVRLADARRGATSGERLPAPGERAF